MKGLSWREGSGLWGEVEWTERAKAMIAAGESKFVSPVFLYDKKTGAVTNMLMAAIVNNPGLDGMADITMRAAARFDLTTEKESHVMNELLLRLPAAAPCGLAIYAWRKTLH